MNDLDLYIIAKQIHLHHHTNDTILNKVWSKVKKVGENFSINEKLEIEIPSMKILNEKQIPVEKVQQVVSGGLTHEDGHAFLFPFITQLNVTYAVGKGYSDSIKIPFDTRVFSAINNILSDIINEIILIKIGILGSEFIPTLNKYYVYLPNKKEYDEFIEKRSENEKDPLKALFMQHILSTSISTYKKKTKNEKYFSNILYGYLHSIGDINTRDTRLLETILAYMVTLEGLKNYYKSADEMYEILKNVERGDLVVIEDPNAIYEKITANLTRDIITAYIVLLLAFYRLTIEKQTPLQQLTQLMTIKNDVKLQPPDETLIEGTLQALTERDNFLDEKALERAATILLNQALTTMETEWTTETMSTETSVPWYRHPRGKLIQSTLTRDILEWKTRTTVLDIGYKKETITGGLPKNITIVIDESGSTGNFTSVLNKITKTPLKIFDAERIIAMSLLYNTLNMGGENIPVNLIRFSTNVIHKKYTIKTAYEILKRIYPMQESTLIDDAISIAVKHHKDDKHNYFILLTDMEITSRQAEEITQKLEKIRQSPLMILIIGEILPKELLKLKRRNTAIINITTEKDLTKIEEAIRTIIR
ncbi:MAG: vWA domain-containing protein [Thermoprotei archaeon]